MPMFAEAHVFTREEKEAAALCFFNEYKDELDGKGLRSLDGLLAVDAKQGMDYWLRSLWSYVKATPEFREGEVQGELLFSHQREFRECLAAARERQRMGPPAALAPVASESLVAYRRRAPKVLRQIH